MPRPNRYHPYTRHPTLPSSRYSPQTSPRTRPLPIITEEPTPLAHPYQYIPPAYIRGVTTDGKSLIARSIIQSADGILHVQMQVAPFPSEQVGLGGLGMGSGRWFAGERWSCSPETSPGLMMGGRAVERIRGEDVVGNGSLTFGSQDGGSEASSGEECGVGTAEEDADGEAEEEGMGGGAGAAGDAFAYVDFGMQIEAMRKKAGMKMMR